MSGSMSATVASRGTRGDACSSQCISPSGLFAYL